LAVIGYWHLAAGCWPFTGNLLLAAGHWLNRFGDIQKKPVTSSKEPAASNKKPVARGLTPET